MPSMKNFEVAKNIFNAVFIATDSVGVRITNRLLPPITNKIDSIINTIYFDIMLS